ncbi:hypothetical protein CMMCAS02_15450 [Clavibacter michiganensis subsp. michiganensis]|uniref:hypothetical protein n=1 Tax=Clavibacter michiganensis TaxID=28447 RepID=UPI000A3602D6|nr:hypothetical protein [Clavibacter michiganensis]MDO4138752.1 hypothetical protein [Clavibacter michiganensis]MWJ06124.1 hypothetical protein [Clavibacter michiganensis subsp. michiganensis]OUD84317.1 hypothetical protein CMMCAS02_15450 [Clavibacter michiganensis subsp. michiganensis]OUD88661.1 hypothetical protein CMMCAS03_12440 [Clavibacter michiganensis subsp. michiganensis]OUE17589.1 hypothetical protein CMMCA002_15650 [Clavibacter michiganensis subsp. michiganensis]
MSWWIRTHRGAWLLALTVVTGVFVATVGDVTFLFPALQGSTPFGRVALVAAVPVVPAIALSAALHAGSRGNHLVASRRVMVGDALLTIGVIAVTAITMVAALPLGASPSVVEAGMRNTIAYICLAMVTGAYGGYRQQAITPVVYLLLASLFGREAGGTVAVWAWPVGAGDDVAFMLVPVILAAAAAFVLGRRIARGRVDAGGRMPPA